jgi:hypothetical protein
MRKQSAAAKASPASISLEPDVLVSHQYFKIFRAQSQFSPEQLLMFAVLTDAVECFQKYLGAKSRAGRNLLHEAEVWISSGDCSWAFSFEYICESFDLDPNYIRAGLAKWRRTHQLEPIPRKRIRESLRYQNRVKHNRLYIPDKQRLRIVV